MHKVRSLIDKHILIFILKFVFVGLMGSQVDAFRLSFGDATAVVSLIRSALRRMSLARQFLIANFLATTQSYTFVPI
jgi:hypothetical protein